MTETFEKQRPRLMALAYRMLGSAAEAEDIVQEAYLRGRSAPSDVASPEAWWSTVVTRLCLDHLKSARVKREEYAGPWLPEPVRTDDESDPESISLALLLLLETLTPVERAVYVLHEVFDYSHTEIADIVEKDEATCRQILKRAKTHIAEKKPRFAPTPEAHQLILGRFMNACVSGDLEGLRSMLSADAIAWSDGGGRVSAATRPVKGAEHVARLSIGLAKKASSDFTAEVATINGWPAIVGYLNGVIHSIVALETDGETISSLHIVLNPEKLRHLGALQPHAET